MDSPSTATASPALHLTATERSRAVVLDKWTVLAALALMVALVLCVWANIDRTVWADEAWMVHAAHEATAVDTLGRMSEWKMPGAVGYVTVLHWLVDWFPGQIAPMRMISVLAAAAVLLIMGVWLGRLIGNPTVGMALAATLLASIAFQRFATEIKQYMLSAALSLGMIEAMTCWLRTRSRRAVYTWFALALAGVLFAYGTWFAVAGTGLMAGIWVLVRKDWIQLRRLVLVGGGVMAVALTVHFLYTAEIASGTANLNRWLPGGQDQGVSIPYRLYLAARLALGVFWTQHPLVYTLPLALFVPIGFAFWLWRQPITAGLTLSMFTLLVAANTVGKWAIWLRMNLPTMMAVHLCLLALPIALVVFVMWFSHRKAEGPTAENSGMPKWFAPAGLALTLALCGFGVYRAANQGYQPHHVDRLMDMAAAKAGADDLVILDISCLANQHFRNTAFQAKTMVVHWPTEKSLAFLPHVKQRTLITISLWNHSSHDAMKALGETLKPHGRLRLIEESHMVGLFEYLPHSQLN